MQKSQLYLSSVFSGVGIYGDASTTWKNTINQKHDILTSNLIDPFDCSNNSIPSSQQRDELTDHHDNRFSPFLFGVNWWAFVFCNILCSDDHVVKQLSPYHHQLPSLWTPTTR